METLLNITIILIAILLPAFVVEHIRVAIKQKRMNWAAIAGIIFMINLIIITILKN